jgi:hypothetical protein
MDWWRDMIRIVTVLMKEKMLPLYIWECLIIIKKEKV